jgi:XRE family transcriptional regulator, fatty acid utilization regulator
MRATDANTLRFTLGLKLRSLRKQRGLQLGQLAERTGIAISYLSEIEKGKKFPKPEKLLDLAAALGVPYDELVSQRVEGGLDAVRSLVESDGFRGFPFHLFGFETEDVFSLVSRNPDRAGALLRTFLEIGRTYDLDVEHFLLAALRSYQQMNGNHFPDLEEAAERYRQAHGWTASRPPTAEQLAATLAREWGYTIDEATLGNHPTLRPMRSVYLDGPPPRLLVNGRLLPSQRAFVLAREIGFRHLGLVERPATSSWIKVESFAQVLNNFRASYFAGALLVDRGRLAADLGRLFARASWDAAAVLRLLTRHNATPETLFHRLTEVLPGHFGLAELFFLRFSLYPGAPAPKLTKVYNLSQVAVPHGLSLNETYCRRWPALRLLAPPPGTDPRATVIEAARLRFLGAGAEFLVLTSSRPLALDTAARSTVALGLRVDARLADTVAFVDDPKLRRLEVNLTCERCELAACDERAAPPRLHQRWQENAQRERAVAELAQRAHPGR